MSLQEQKDEVKKTEDQCVESKDSTTASCSSVSDGSDSRSNKSLRMRQYVKDRKMRAEALIKGIWTPRTSSPATLSPTPRCSGRTSDPRRESKVMSILGKNERREYIERMKKNRKTKGESRRKGNWTPAWCSSLSDCCASSSHTTASPATAPPTHRSLRTDNSIENHWNSSLKKRSEFYSSTGRLRPAARNRVLDNVNELSSSDLERIRYSVTQTPSLATDVNNLDEDIITSSAWFEELEIGGVNERARSPQVLEPEPLPENRGVALNGEKYMFGNEPTGSTPIASQNCFFTPPPCRYKYSSSLNTEVMLRRLSEGASIYPNRPSILRKRPCRFVVPESSSAAETDEHEVIDRKVNDGGEDNTRSFDCEDVGNNGTEAYDLSPYCKKTNGKVVIKPRRLEFEFNTEEEEKKGDDEMK